MRRTFTHNGQKYEIVNRYTGEMEINSASPKYDIYNGNGWCGHCMTIREGIEKIKDGYVYVK